MARIARPATLQLLNGRSEGKDSGGRSVKSAPAFRRIAPQPPTWLSREARAEWRRVVPGLQRLDLLKEEDRAALAAYCETWATFVDATRMVRREGLTIDAKQGTLPHPAVGIARSSGRELRAFAAHFGLTPSSEMALGKVNGDGEEDQNPFGAQAAQAVPEVAWYLQSRGIPLPDCPPAIKTPEPGETLPGRPVRPGAGRQGPRRVRAAAAHEGQVGRAAAEAGPVAGRLHPGAVFGWVRLDKDIGRWVRVIRELLRRHPAQEREVDDARRDRIYMTAADGEAGAEVIAAATTKDQAGFVFAPVKALAEKAPALKGHLQAFASKIVHPAVGVVLPGRSRRSRTLSTARTSTAR
jgi:P27 family predicted phage terminase small subunit